MQTHVYAYENYREKENETVGGRETLTSSALMMMMQGETQGH